jgi:site-specific recombinase XerD
VLEDLDRISVDRGQMPQRREMTEWEARTLVSCHDLDEPEGVRDRAVFMVIADTGLRYSAVAFAPLEGFDRHEGRLTVREKRNHIRTVPLSEETVQAIRSWLRICPVCKRQGCKVCEKNGPSPHLFVKVTSGKGHSFTKDGGRSIWRRVQRRAKDANAKFKATPHDARRAIARRALRGKEHRSRVQDMMGWDFAPAIGRA